MICCYKSDKIMNTYKIKFLTGKVTRQEYVDAVKIDGALNEFRRGKYGNHKVISISEC